MELVGCPSCGYEIEHTEGTVCPECGVAVDARLMEVIRARLRVAAVDAKHTRVQTVVWILVLLVYGWGAWISAGVFDGFYVAVLGLGIGLIGSMAVGLMVSRIAAEEERVYVRWVWRRWFPMLHAPWLMIGPLTVVGAGVGLLVRGGDQYDVADLLWMVAGIAFLGWLLSALVWILLWGMFTARSVQELGLGGRGKRLVWVGLSAWAVVVICVCVPVGFAGGQLGFWFVMRVAGVVEVHMWDF